MAVMGVDDFSIKALETYHGFGVPLIKRFSYQASTSTFDSGASATYGIGLLEPKKGYLLNSVHVLTGFDNNSNQVELNVSDGNVSTLANPINMSALNSAGLLTTWSAYNEGHFNSLSSQVATLCVSHHTLASTLTDIDIMLEEFPVGGALRNHELASYTVAA